METYYPRKSGIKRFVVHVVSRFWTSDKFFTRHFQRVKGTEHVQGWTRAGMDACRDGRVQGWTRAGMDACRDGRVQGWTRAGMDACRDGRVQGWTRAGMDR